MKVADHLSRGLRGILTVVLLREQSRSQLNHLINVCHALATVFIKSKVTEVIREVRFHGLSYPNAWGWAGPGGRDIADNQYPLPGRPINSCIGRIGISGTVFSVGETVVFRVNTAGRLYLGINDFILNDNLGGFVAFVYESRRPFTTVGDHPSGLPSSALLSQNYPNPFNPSTTISFETPKRDNVQINIYNSLGQLVRTLLNELREAGTHSVVWDGRDNAGSVVASGSYFYQVHIGEYAQAKKMILLK